MISGELPEMTGLKQHQHSVIQLDHKGQTMQAFVVTRSGCSAYVNLVMFDVLKAPDSEVSYQIRISLIKKN